MHARVILGVGKGVLSSKCMQEWYFGWEKVSCLDRCPHCKSDTWGGKRCPV